METQVYSATDIQHMLGLGKTKTYEYLERVHQEGAPFRVIKIGRLFRVPKASFDHFINSIS